MHDCIHSHWKALLAVPGVIVRGSHTEGRCSSSDDTIMTGVHVDPNPKSHLWVGKCVEDWTQTANTHLVQMHMAKGKFNSTSSDVVHALQQATTPDMCNTACLVMDENMTLNANARLKSCSVVGQQPHVATLLH